MNIWRVALVSFVGLVWQCFGMHMSCISAKELCKRYTAPGYASAVSALAELNTVYDDPPAYVQKLQQIPPQQRIQMLHICEQEQWQHFKKRLQMYDKIVSLPRDIQQAVLYNCAHSVSHFLYRTIIATYAPHGIEAYAVRQDEHPLECTQNRLFNVFNDGIVTMRSKEDLAIKQVLPCRYRRQKKDDPLVGHTRAVHSIIETTDSGRIITAADDQMLKLWDAQRCKCLATLATNVQKQSITPCTWQHKKHLLFATATHMHLLELSAPFICHTLGRVYGACSNMCATPTHVVWNTKRHILRLPFSYASHISKPITSWYQDKEVHNMALFPDKKHCAVATEKDIHIWNVQAGKRLNKSIECPKPIKHVYPYVYYDDKGQPHMRVLARALQTVFIGDYDSQKIITQFDGHKPFVRDLYFMDGATRCITTDRSSLYVWDMTHGRLEHCFSHGTEGWMKHCSLFVDTTHAYALCIVRNEHAPYAEQDTMYMYDLMQYKTLYSIKNNLGTIAKLKATTDGCIQRVSYRDNLIGYCTLVPAQEHGFAQQALQYHIHDLQAVRAYFEKHAKKPPHEMMAHLPTWLQEFLGRILWD